MEYGKQAASFCYNTEYPAEYSIRCQILAILISVSICLSDHRILVVFSSQYNLTVSQCFDVTLIIFAFSRVDYFSPIFLSEYGSFRCITPWDLASSYLAVPFPFLLFIRIFLVCQANTVFQSNAVKVRVYD